MLPKPMNRIKLLKKVTLKKQNALKAQMAEQQAELDLVLRGLGGNPATPTS